MYKYMHTAHSDKHGKGSDVRPAKQSGGIAAVPGRTAPLALDFDLWHFMLAGSTGKAGDDAPVAIRRNTSPQRQAA